MKLKIRFAVFLLYLVSLLTLLAIAKPQRINAIADIDFTKTKQLRSSGQDAIKLNQFSPVFGCPDLPPPNPPNPALPAALTSEPITLDRFRRAPQLVAAVTPPPVATAPTTPTAPTASPELAAKPLAVSKVAETSKISQKIAAPKELIALADSSNYGDRYLKDLNGRPATQEPIIVLHETVGSTGSVMSYFQTFHSDEDEQASYHSLITPDGTVVYFVPPDKRAFGAGDSEFVSSLGKEAVQTSPHHPRSVNNFAYHIALETPADGMNDDKSHSGYTEAQYRSLAWLITRTSVPGQRITTHRAVDRSGSRIDPRSFNFQVFKKLLNGYPRTQEIFIGCQAKPNGT